MRTSEVRAKAKLLGIEPGKMKKTELVRAVQKAEGATVCFATGRQDCPYKDCCFWSDCMEEDVFTRKVQ